MPGVPCSRGCDSCRAQKKKCDQSQPACSRCKRLSIQCTGCGVRRYAFRNQFVGKQSKQSSNNSMSGQHVTAAHMTRMPGNALSSLTALVVNRLDIKDLRHNMQWAYGPFLDGIPARLGRSDALDTATCTLFTPGCEESSDSSLLNYTRALGAMRSAVLDVKEGFTTDTLCAIYFLWLFQRRSDGSSKSSMHVAAIAQILNCGTGFQFDKGFDRGLVYTVCSIVTSESLLDPAIVLMSTSPCWEFFGRCLSSPVPFGPCHPVLDEFELTRQLAGFLCLLPALLKQRPCASAVEFHYRNLLSVVQQFEMRHIHSRAALHTSTESIPTTCSKARDRTHRFLQDLRSYGLSLTLAATMNTILRVYEPEEVFLLNDITSITRAIVAVAYEAGKFGPIAAGFVSPFLDTAWAVDESSRQSILAVARSHQVGFTVGRATIFAAKLQRVLDTLRRSMV